MGSKYIITNLYANPIPYKFYPFSIPRSVCSGHCGMPAGLW